MAFLSHFPQWSKQHTFDFFSDVAAASSTASAIVSDLPVPACKCVHG